MDALRPPSPSQTTEHWWTLPSWEAVCLIAIKYRRILFGLLVALLFVFVQGRLNTMDQRLFQPSTDGARGLIYYERGNYSNAALAYRSDLRRGVGGSGATEMKPIMPSFKEISLRQHDWLTYSSPSNPTMSKHG